MLAIARPPGMVSEIELTWSEQRVLAEELLHTDLSCWRVFWRTERSRFNTAVCGRYMIVAGRNA